MKMSGKRNLPAFVGIAIPFGIPVGVLYDEDSSEFKHRHSEQRRFNQQSDVFQKAHGSVRVWRMSQNHADHLRAMNHGLARLTG